MKARTVLIFLLLLGALSTSAFALSVEPNAPRRLGGTGAVAVTAPVQGDVHAAGHWELLFGFLPLFFYEVSWEPAESALYYLKVTVRDGVGDVLGEGESCTEDPVALGARTDLVPIEPIPSLADVASVDVIIVQREAGECLI